MGDFARRVVINLDTNEVTIDGQEFPWFYAGASPTIAESPDGQTFPGVTITIACTDVQTIKPSEVIEDADPT